MREFLLTVYERLYAHFGPRYWWPAETPFEMIVGAILTQNVAWKGAAQAIANLKEKGWLAPRALLEAPEEELAALVRPARYHRQKAQRLKDFCRVVVEECGGDLEVLLK